MEKECEIVKDLLFSYNDGVLSNTSKELVEKHLEKCGKCQEALREIQDENREQSEKKDIDYLKKIRRKLNRKTIYICIGVILLFSVIIFNLLVLKNYNETACLMEIYLDDNITDEQSNNIKDTILSMTKNSNIEIEYRSKEQEFEIMKEKMKHNPSLLDGINNVFPASYRVKTSTKKIKDIESAVKIMSGVKSVNSYIDENPYLLFLYKK